MSLSIGIVGLPNVGKSTLFNALTRKSVLVANYPFATIDPSVGVVAVPDARVDKLAALSQSEKKIPAAVEFVDIAGLVKGASQGEGLGNQFLSHIREADAIAQVVRIFENPNIGHVENRVDPFTDIEIINFELIVADAATLGKRVAALEREARAGKKEALAEQAVAEKVLAALEDGKLARSVYLEKEERALAASWHLLTMKPMLYVLNREAGGHNLDEMKGDERYERLMRFFEETKAHFVAVDAGVENELRDLLGEDKESFRREYGVFDDGIGDLIRAGYDLLGLITFFTTGKDETRGWTIARGARAPEAGAAIHSDFRDKFIRAEVIHCKDLLTCGGFAAARERGLVRTEGKEYLVEDGDVIEFLHG